MHSHKRERNTLTRIEKNPHSDERERFYVTQEITRRQRLRNTRISRRGLRRRKGQLRGMVGCRGLRRCE